MEGCSRVSNPAVGDEIQYRVWEDPVWVEHFAIVSVAPPAPHGRVNLFFGTGGTHAVNVDNIESFAFDQLEGNDHWRNVRAPFRYDWTPYPIETREAFIGTVVAFRKWNAAVSEFDILNAIVLAVPGGPGQDHPTVNLTWFDVEGKHNQNRVVPVEDLVWDSGPGGYESTDHWINHPAHS